MPRLHLDPDRLFPVDPKTRDIARSLYGIVANAPLVCPHGHVDPAILAQDTPFPDPAELFITPDHYLVRMLYSQGIAMESIGIPRRDGVPTDHDPREVWRLLCENWHLFRGTPSKIWIEHVLADVFDVDLRPSAETADELYDHLSSRLQEDDFRPRALFERFGIEVLATTDCPSQPLLHHQQLRSDPWPGRVIPTWRPDRLVNIDAADWRSALEDLASVTGSDTHTYAGYMEALSETRRAFIELGATSSDHGHPTADTTPLDEGEATRIFNSALSGAIDAGDAERFRAHMLMAFAEMSVEDGLVMQLHVGAFRDHNPTIWERYGPDRGADIPQPTDYVNGLKPLLDRFGNDPRLTLVLSTLDESTVSRELAPLAGHYPAVYLGPPWWFFDSPEGMARFRANVTEIAGFYNTAGFNDDTRAFLSIPARHDMARRADAAFLARLVAEGRLAIDEAEETIIALAGDLARKVYRL